VRAPRAGRATRAAPAPKILRARSRPPPPAPSPTTRSAEEDRVFESALEQFWDRPDRLERTAGALARRDAAAAGRRLAALAADVAAVEAGRAPPPPYPAAGEPSLSVAQLQRKAKAADTERRKGVPWTEEEHRLFLMGLAKFGKGDWRSISRNFVITRTPTQVASHDITSVEAAARAGAAAAGGLPPGVAAGIAAGVPIMPPPPPHRPPFAR
jgi:SHAQKYF class myb-like DNA-binding protein